MDDPNQLTGFPDFCRWFAACQGGFVILASIIVFAKYSRVAIASRSKRSLPWHVALISFSYIICTVFIGLELIGRVGNPWTYRIPLAGVAFVLGDAALCFLLTHLFAKRNYADKLRERLVSAESSEDRASRHITESSETITERACRQTKENVIP